MKTRWKKNRRVRLAHNAVTAATTQEQLNLQKTKRQVEKIVPPLWTVMEKIH